MASAQQIRSSKYEIISEEQKDILKRHYLDGMKTTAVSVEITKKIEAAASESGLSVAKVKVRHPRTFLGLKRAGNPARLSH